MPPTHRAQPPPSWLARTSLLTTDLKVGLPCEHQEALRLECEGIERCLARLQAHQVQRTASRARLVQQCQMLQDGGEPGRRTA